MVGIDPLPSVAAAVLEQLPNGGSRYKATRRRGRRTQLEATAASSDARCSTRASREVKASRISAAADQPMRSAAGHAKRRGSAHRCRARRLGLPSSACVAAIPVGPGEALSTVTRARGTVRLEDAGASSSLMRCNRSSANRKLLRRGRAAPGRQATRRATLPGKAAASPARPRAGVRAPRWRCRRRRRSVSSASPGRRQAVTEAPHRSQGAMISSVGK